jgi:hypothetical protein
MCESLIYKFDNQINFSQLPDRFKLPRNIKSLVSDFWTKKKETNINFFNGIVYTLESISERKDRFTILFSETDYAHYLASEIDLLPEEYKTRTIYTSALIETIEGEIGIAIMGENSFEPGRIQYIGGSIDSNHIKDQTIDFRKCIESELMEEIYIDVHDSKQVESCTPIFLSCGLTKKKISVIFHLKMKINAHELRKILKDNNLKSESQNHEVHDFIFFKKTDFPFIRNKLKDAIVDENLYSSLDAFINHKSEKDYRNIVKNYQ